MAMIDAVMPTTMPIGIGWLRSRRFDLALILGVPALGLGSGVLVTAEPRLLAPVILLDIWLLSYQHLGASFTRLCFDPGSFRRYWFLLFGLPPLVVAATGFLEFGVASGLPVTIYLYWLWFHYARQSWGIAQIYRRRAGAAADFGDATLFKATFALVPLWGILHRSAQAPTEFMGFGLHFMPVPPMLADGVGIAACVAVVLWLVERGRAWRRERAPIAHTLYVLTHFVMFYVAYVLIDDVTTGWLVINIWHNVQYLGVVWLFHQRRFNGALDPEARLLSRLAQPRNVVLYIAACLVPVAALYLGIMGIVGLLPATAFLYQVVNFHHYIVDAVIWRSPRRRPAPAGALAARA